MALRLLALVAASLLLTVACAGGSPEAASPTASAAATMTVATPTPTPAATATPLPAAPPTATATVAVTPTTLLPTAVQPTPTRVPVTAPPPPPSPTQAPAAPPPPPSGVAAPIRGYGFPYQLDVDVGTTVVWTNYDSVLHNVVAADESWGSDLLHEGESFSHTFTASGRYGYVCTVHPYMKAVLIVR